MDEKTKDYLIIGGMVVLAIGELILFSKIKSLTKSSKKLWAHAWMTDERFNTAAVLVDAIDPNVLRFEPGSSEKLLKSLTSIRKYAEASSKI